ncbi:DUF1269 domain-containing protein [Thiohalophilus sp.]|uniref:DUF1269 domain-containing protein n=1 Tax=Thiohalophilus sp. TaxID=3028392 RepID=UPI003976810B
MRRRLYFILPDVKSAQSVHDELLLAKVEERHIHVLARSDMELGDLPEASLLQRSDLIHGAQLGAIVGAFAGVLLGTLAVIMGYIVPGLEVLSVGSITVGGALIGLFASTMVAVNIPNSRLKGFRTRIEQGYLLIMVDVPVEQVETLSKRVKQHHPEAEVRDVDPTIPAFP